MNKEMKKRWITALRDPKNKQTQGRLQNLKGKMCCLGVLCDIEIDGYWVLNDYGYQIGIDRSGSPEGYILPVELERKADIGNLFRLMKMNDHEGKSFAEIADYIEENE